MLPDTTGQLNNKRISDRSEGCVELQGEGSSVERNRYDERCGNWGVARVHVFSKYFMGGQGKRRVGTSKWTGGRFVRRANRKQTSFSPEKSCVSEMLEIFPN